jgi:hypothetical protein
LTRAGLAAVLGAACAAGGAVGAQAPRAPGQYDVGVSTRTFDSPLFGDDHPVTYRLFGSQAVPGAGRYQLWLDGGLTGYEVHFGLRGEGIAAGRQVLSFDAGDVALHALAADPRTSLGDSYPLRGVEVRGRREQLQWSAFAGRAYYDSSTPMGERHRPSLAGGRFLLAHGRNEWGGEVTLVGDAPFADPERDGDPDAVLTGRYARRVAPRATLFAETFTATAGLGARAGSTLRGFRGELSSALYAFDDGMPYIHPLFRPGERGLELRGRYDASTFASMHGAVYYATDDAVFERDELRGSVGVRFDVDPRGAVFAVDYSHDDVVYRTLDQSEDGTVADRLALTASRAENHGYMGLTVEHAWNADASLDRSQASFLLRRAIGARTLLEGSSVIQRDETASLGATAEAAVERPLAGALSYLAGLGAAWVEHEHEELRQGEGVLRLGLSRDIRGTGWRMRAEARVPFSIGLERSSLNRQVLALDFGHRFAWNDLGELGSAFRRSGGEGATGSIAGTVLVDGQPRGGIGVIVDGEPRATTRRDGSFVIDRQPVGETLVTLDLRALDPGYDIAGEPARTVFLTPGITAHVEFGVERFNALQGALVRCEGERLVAVKAARVTLDGAGFSREVTTSVLGAFRVDRVPAGSYVLAVDPADGSAVRRFTVDLRDSLLGFVLALDCPGSPGAPGGPIAPLDDAGPP